MARLVGLTAIAKTLGVCEATIHNWIAKDQFPAYQAPTQGNYSQPKWISYDELIQSWLLAKCERSREALRARKQARALARGPQAPRPKRFNPRRSDSDNAPVDADSTKSST